MMCSQSLLCVCVCVCVCVCETVMIALKECIFLSTVDLISFTPLIQLCVQYNLNIQIYQQDYIHECVCYFCGTTVIV